MSDPELERVYKGIADRSKPKAQDPPKKRERVRSAVSRYRTKVQTPCPIHAANDYKCKFCRRVYNREWMRKRKEKANETVQ